MATDQPYGLIDSYDGSLSIHTCKDGVGSRDDYDFLDRMEHEGNEIIFADNITNAVLERMRSWCSPESMYEHVLVESTHEDDSQWFTNICLQLPDHSVHIDTIVLNCNSYLPFHLLIPKIAACKTLRLNLSIDDEVEEPLPPILDNLQTLHQLSRSICTPHIRYVEVLCYDHKQDRQEQVRVLLQHVAHFTFQAEGYAFFESDDSVLPELVAAKPHNLRVSVIHARAPRVTNFIHAVSDSLTTLDLDIGFTTYNDTLPALLQAVQSLPRLHALRLSTDTGCQATSPLNPLVTQLLECGVHCCALDELHISIDDKLLKSDHDVFSFASVQQRVRAVLSTWKSSILCSSVAIVQHGGAEYGKTRFGYSTARYQLLFDEVKSVGDRNRVALASDVHRLLHRYRITEPNIAVKVLRYLHTCYA